MNNTEVCLHEGTTIIEAVKLISKSKSNALDIKLTVPVEYHGSTEVLLEDLIDHMSDENLNNSLQDYLYATLDMEDIFNQAQRDIYSESISFNDISFSKVETKE